MSNPAAQSSRGDWYRDGDPDESTNDGPIAHGCVVRETMDLLFMEQWNLLFGYDPSCRVVVWVGSPDETPRRWNDGSIVRGTMDLLFGLTIGYCSIMKTLCYRVKIVGIIYCR